MKQLSIILILLLITGCANLPKNLKHPETPESSIIGISIKTRSIIRVFKNRPETVYFIKIEGEEGEYPGSKIFPSNFVKKDIAYLVDAKPGRYAAVASNFIKSDMGYNTFYDINTIKNTAVDVGPGEIVFAGKFIIDDHLQNLDRNIEKNGDKAQLHFYSMLKSLMYGTFYCGTLHNVDKSKTAEREFLVEARKDFIESGWADLIGKKLESLGGTE